MAYLVHPASRAGRPCEVTADGWGLALRLLPDGRVRRISWAGIEGLSADSSVEASDGSHCQIVAVATAEGTLELFMEAPEVSVLMGEVGAAARAWSMWRTWGIRHGVKLVEPAANVLRARPEAQASLRVLRRGIAVVAPRRRALIALGMAMLLVVVGIAVGRASAPPSRLQIEVATAGAHGFSENAEVMKVLGTKSTDLPKAKSAPAPAPPNVADAAPLVSHEVFGFAPYWTLGQSAGFDVADLTTIAYFSIGVHPDGTLAKTGSGWSGYESAALTALISRAHAAGDRVVLTVNCFGQSTLDHLTSTPAAPGRLSTALLGAIAAKNMDGVNLDFEGQGSGDQKGLTNLVRVVSATLHRTNPHYQVTMDTYASSASDSAGFYNIPALAPSVDGFFVMAYELNLASGPSAASPLTSTMFSNTQAASEYASVVAPSKVILGMPFYGYQWPTTNGTMAAHATGGATPIAYSTIVSLGEPTYWDNVTQTAWTSFQIRGQWYEDYFEDPYSTYLIAQLAQHYGLAGVGAWALGMDGNSVAMMQALAGNSPAAKGTLAGPTSTSTSVATPSSTTTTTIPTIPGTTTTTTTTTTVPGPSVVGTGTFNGATVELTKTTPLGGSASYVGILTGFASSTTSLACLAEVPSLSVWSTAGQDIVVARTPTDCVAADFKIISAG